MQYPQSFLVRHRNKYKSKLLISLPQKQKMYIKIKNIEHNLKTDKGSLLPSKHQITPNGYT